MKRLIVGAILVAALPLPAVAMDHVPRVAILDSGLWENWAVHPEFRAVDVVGWRDFQDDSPTPVDPLGHGTAVASRVVGETLGYARGAELLVGRVLDAGDHTTWNVVVAGIDWAVENGADVINVSLWSPTVQPAANVQVAQAISRARAAGVLTVWISGNDYGGSVGAVAPSTVLVGGSSPQALVVGSADADGAPSSFSRPDPEVLGYGRDVVVAARSATDPYTRGTGTSFAAPTIAGAAARLLAEGAPRDPDWLEWVLLHAAADDPDAPYIFEGFGIFDDASMTRAIDVARGARPMPEPDARDLFHAATSVPRAGITGELPRGILPP